MPYKALTAFLDDKRRVVLMGAELDDNYDEATIARYLKNNMIMEAAAPGPKPKNKKPAKPGETK